MLQSLAQCLIVINALVALSVCDDLCERYSCKKMVAGTTQKVQNTSYSDDLLAPSIDVTGCFNADTQKKCLLAMIHISRALSELYG
jgi:hypothetical protein